ncbi:MAG: AI-2E family transporter, partial [Lachnospiraceae bacterium]|nr:AI-2E family transporter [Lachnospiraceae bacterium]
AVEISKEAGAYILSFLAKALVTLVAAFLMLHEYEYVIGLFQKTWAGKKAFEILRHMKNAFGAYLKAQIIIMGIITAICVAGMYLSGSSYALPVGIGIGLFDALPFLGTGTILVPWTFIDVLMGRYFAGAVHFLIYLVCTCVRQFLEPRLVGKTLGVPPLFVLMSLYIGIQVYGGAGVLLGPISALLIYEIWLINTQKEEA